jgi:hypothetical protein
MIHEPLQAIEAFSFVIAFSAFSIMMGFSWKKKPHLFLFFMGFFCIVLGLLFTNLESIMFQRTFNLLEHVFRLLLPGVFFAKAAFDISKRK